MVVTLANVMLRQAEKTDNPRQYLDDLITAQWGVVSTQGGQIVGTTVNGKTLTLQAFQGMTGAHILAAANIALGLLERGVDACPRQTVAIFR